MNNEETKSSAVDQKQEDPLQPIRESVHSDEES